MVPAGSGPRVVRLSGRFHLDHVLVGDLALRDENALVLELIVLVEVAQLLPSARLMVTVWRVREVDGKLNLGTRERARVCTRIKTI